MITHIAIMMVHFILFGSAFSLSCWLSWLPVLCCVHIVLEEVEEWDYIHVFNLDGVDVFNLSPASQIMFNDKF